MSKVRLAIIGNGMVGHRFIEDLLDKSDAANFDITFSVKNRASLMTAYTSRLTSLTTPPKSCRWCAKASTRNTASKFWSANALSPSTVRRR
ncbi:nitrite reductase [NAD(P)H] large subunit [Escherichia coli]|uniref:Nitrite reductase [NAD(P)H] large subunit n=1 Tax=Escherichia coli TaxID=562 RepID=A0A377BYC8_ECOLX|nr:nitrite reductase [NAD(P)H] large subunit [Escherichia coli]